MRYASIVRRIQIIQFDLEKLGFEPQCINKEIIITQKNAVTTSVVDKVNPILADELIKYNHYILQGKLEEKRRILLAIADALEPKRSELEKIDSRITSDFFYMVNNMNVRHNNIDEEGSKYNPKFALLPAPEMEMWYDEIYQQGLFAFLLLEQKKRANKIQAFKKNA